MDENIKTVEIGGTQYRIKKFDAKTAIKVAKMLLAKILPILDSDVDVLQDVSLNRLTEFSFVDFGAALDRFQDNDVDKLIDTALKNCFKPFPAGDAPVINDNGSFGVPEVEYSPVLTLRLTYEAVRFGISGFFEEGLLDSFQEQIQALFPSEGQT